MLDITQDYPKGFTTRFSDSEVRSAHQEKSLLLLALVSGFVFNSLFESFLQRQSRSVFYPIWVSLILVHLNTNGITKKSQKT
jgi:hypothetical protein